MTMALEKRPGQTRSRPRALGGLQKAAVLLVSIGSEAAAQVFRHLAEDEIEELSLEMAKLQQLDHGTTEFVHEELVAMVQAYGSLLSGGIDYACEVLERSVGPERAAEIAGRLTTVIEKRPFAFLRNISPERIVSFLRSESAQTIALVVAHLHPTLAGQVLSQLPDTLQAESALRIAEMGTVSPDVVRDVDKQMRQNFAGVAQPETSAVSGAQWLAQILSRGDRSTERNVLDGLAETDEQLAAEVRHLLLTFEDIIELDDRALQLVVREADQKDLALALRGTGDDIRQRIMSSMSARAAQMLSDDLETQPPQRRRVIEDAQGRIVAIVRRLEDAGTIILARAEDDAVL
jgi:flagellar motor switch protein FliG